MNKYKHGITVNEIATKSISIEKAQNNIPVILGIAPINLAEDSPKLNEPVLIKSIEDAKKQLGYLDNFEEYTISEAVKAVFELNSVGPVVAINVLDKEKHKSAIVEKAYTVINGIAKIEERGILKETVIIKAGEEDATLQEGIDYILKFNDNGHLLVELVKSEVNIKASYTKLDTKAVTKNDIIDGINKIKMIYQNLNIIPSVLVAPGFSKDKEVSKALISATKEINGLFNCMTILDLDADTNKNITMAIEYKNANIEYRSENAIITYPKIKYKNDIYNMSTITMSTILKTDIENDNVPYVSPSNKAIKADSLVLEDGINITIDYDEANELNANGIVTALNIKGYRLWGNNTSIYPENEDMKDRFIAIKRMFYWWGNTFIENYFEKVDNPLNFRMIEALVNDENIRANGFKSAMQLAEARIEYREDENTQEELLAGRIKFREILVPFPPVEHIENVLEFDANALLNNLNGEVE